MIEANTSTLEDLAEAFGLTPRTARHYIEKVLPPHHKQGRGKLARYGQDTWNCFAFIQKVRAQAGVTMAYLTEVLASLEYMHITVVAFTHEIIQKATQIAFEHGISLYAACPVALGAGEVDDLPGFAVAHVPIPGPPGPAPGPSPSSFPRHDRRTMRPVCPSAT